MSAHHQNVATRLYVPQVGAPQLSLHDDAILQAIRPVRLKPGDCIHCFSDGSDHYVYRLEGIGRKELRLSLVRTEPCVRNPTKPIVLIQAIGKSGKADDVVKHATALGVTEIDFVETHRTIGRLEASRLERLQAIAIESCRQCGRTALPNIRVIASNHSWWTELALPGVKLFCDEESAHPLKHYLSDQRDGCALAVGPEGGWASEERAGILNAGWQPVSLGKRILRTELAAVAALGIVCHLLDV